MTTTTLPTSPTILKADNLGRVRTPVADREALLDAFEQSGMSGAAFCKAHGLRYTTFASWRQKRRKKQAEVEAAEPEVEAPLFEEVELPWSRPRTGSLPVELPGGARFTLTGADQLPLAAALLRYLDGSC